MKKDSYLTKAIYQAKTAELQDEYAKKGFLVKKVNQASPFDLILEHQESKRIIAFQIQLAPLSKDDLAKVEQAKKEALAHDYNFRLVTIVRPLWPEIEINWLQTKFPQYLVQHIPLDIANKATKVNIEGAEIVVVSINIVDDKANVLAEGSIDVELEYDISNKQVYNLDTKSNEAFPFTAEMVLDLQKQAIVDMAINVDSSMVY